MKDDADKVEPVGSMLAKLLVDAPILVLLVFVCWKKTLETPTLLQWSPYALSDWLINYEGGFVRRGLSGHWIQSLTQGTTAVGLVNSLIFWNFTIFCGLLLGLIVLSRPITLLKSVMLLLVPGSVYSMIVANEFFFRKEVLFESYLAAVAVAFLMARRSDGSGLSRIFDLLAAILIVGGSTVLPFVHESFLFTSAVPTAVIVYWMGCRWSVRIGRSAALAYLVLLAVQFLALAVFKGDGATRAAIWTSLNPADRAILSPDGQVFGAIEMIGSSLMAALRMPLSVVISGSAWYWLFAIAASAAYLLVLSCAYSPGDNALDRRIAWIFTLYVLCLGGAVPLFGLGGDWGRWIAAVNVATAILICAGEFRQPLPIPGIAPFRPPAALSRRSMYIVLTVALAFTLSFKLPECCVVANGETLAHIFHVIIGDDRPRGVSGGGASPPAAGR